LQKQAAEKQNTQSQFDTQHQQSPSAAASPDNAQSSPALAQQTIVSNEASLGKEVEDKIQSVKAEIAAEKPSAGWFGLGAFAGAFGGAGSKDGEGEGKKSS
jgi:hypothetical protein